MITAQDVIIKLSSIVTYLECPICLSVIEDTHIIPDCGHRFCGNCIEESLRKCNNKCPSCRVHVSTRRRLRSDDLFDNLIQKLSCIIEESTDDRNDIDLKILLDSLKALLWHFQCPLCSNELEDTQISSECLHRFCNTCIYDQMSGSSFALARSGSGSASGSASASATETATGCSLTTGPLRRISKCPFCIDQEQTVFFPDKQYESINKAIRYIINSIEQAEKSNIPDSDKVEIEVINEQSDQFQLEMAESTNETNTNSNAIVENQSSNSWGSHDYFNTDDPFPIDCNLGDKGSDLSFSYEVAGEVSPDDMLNLNESTTMVNDRSVNGKGYANGCGDDSQALSTVATKTTLTNTTVNNTNTSDTGTGTNPEGRSEGKSKPPEQKKQKYKTGSRFVQKDSEKYGRIIGFEDGYYQVFFPHNKSCDHYTEQDFNSVKFIQPHKRPTPTPKGKQQQDRGDSVLCCPRCKSRFSSNPEDDVSGRVPVQSQNCAHVMCIDCVQTLRMASVPKNGVNINRKLRVTVDCPFCKKSKSFNAIEPTIQIVMCQMVSMYERMEHQKNEDRIKRKIKDQDEKEKKSNKKNHHKRTHSSRAEKKNHKERKKIRIEEEDGIRRSSSRDKKKLRRFKCKVCKQEKVIDKFSSKQVEKVKQKSRPMCRRCEEKGILRKQLGPGVDKVSTTIKVAKTHKGKTKFLTTIVPWHNGKALTDGTPLPPDLTIDGYTRDPWGLLQSNNIEQDNCWIRCSFWSSGNGMAPFIEFLKENKKSAYGTFLIDQTDGFFVIPFDQTTPPETSPTKIFQCKYITGLGLLGESSTNDPVSQPASNLADPNVQEEQKSGSLRNLLAAEYKTSQSLLVVPKGSVKSAPKLSSRPEGPAPSLGPSNWYRQRVIIEEGEDDVSPSSGEEEDDDRVKLTKESPTKSVGSSVTSNNSTKFAL